MLKKITLAALLAIGAAAIGGLTAQPAAADSHRTGVRAGHGHVEKVAFRRHVSWAGVSFGRHGPGRNFLKRVRRGNIVCFAARAHRGDRRGHRFYRAHGQRLGYRAVARLVRQGRMHAMRCFRRA